MKKVIMVVLLVLLFGNVYSATPNNLMGIRVGENYIQAKTRITKTFTITEHSDTLFLYTTRLFDKKARVYITGFENKVVAIMVSLTTAEDNYIDTFNTIFQSMTSKYGTSQEKREFQYPYTKGDGHTTTALRLRKANITNWWDDDGYRAVLTIDSDLDVNLVYVEIAQWEKFNNKKKQDSENRI